jgi:hypothetical protein
MPTKKQATIVDRKLDLPATVMSRPEVIRCFATSPLSAGEW